MVLIGSLTGILTRGNDAHQKPDRHPGIGAEGRIRRFLALGFGRDIGADRKREKDMIKKKCTAIVLAAGSGKRMHSATAKQFMLLEGRPILWYSLEAVERSRLMDECILVTGESDISYVRREIVEKYGFQKVKTIVAGGEERYESVYNALQAMEEGEAAENRESYVFIHDGARPFLTEAILESTYREVCRHGACVAAVPAKDTIKIANEDGFVAQTPERSRLWVVQTPQAFETSLIIGAYHKLFEKRRNQGGAVSVTDDAMVVEAMTGTPVKLVEASYGNIKITTPEDIPIAEMILQERNGQKASE